ncbi:MAG TPA: hypothetical protein VFS51_08855 [Gemmatimonadales bacterium]|nr:hypothetical protein [Gemmatimonadales bacterium]
MGGFLNIKLPAWLRRLITRLIAIVPAVIVAARYGERGKMGRFSNGWALQSVAWSVAAAIVGLNGWLLFGTFRERLAW